MSCTVALVVVTYNRVSLLKQALDAIFQSEDIYSILHVIVVDNCSTDETPEFLRNYAEDKPQLNVLRTKKNLGGAGGFAFGISSAIQSGAQWIGLMDDDVLLHPDAVGKVIQHVEPGRLLACMRVNAKGEVVERASRRYDLSSLFVLNPRKQSLCDVSCDPMTFQSLVPVEFASFEGLFFPRELVKEIGLPFSEYFVFGDDLDFCLRARQKGWRIYVVRDARLTRLIDYDRRKVFSSWKASYIWRNFFALHFVYGKNWFVRMKPFLYALLLLLKNPVKVRAVMLSLKEADKLSRIIKTRLSQWKEDL